MMKFTAEQVAQLLGGKVEGDAQASVSDFAKIEEGRPGAISFLANPKYTDYIYSTESSVVIVGEDFVAEKPIQATLVRVPDAYQAFAKALTIYEQNKPRKTGIEKTAHISESAQLGENVYVGGLAYIDDKAVIGNNVRIMPHAFIGEGVVIGDNTIVNSGVKIYEACKIGKDCIIHAGSIIGADGFGFAPNSENNYNKVPQIGNVVLEDHVEIGANTCIDRATIGSTIIRKGAKIDNLIQIAHNVEIGENTVIAAQTGIAGSTKMGANCMVGGQVGIVGHIQIAAGTKIAAQSGLGTTIKAENTIVQGSPAFGIGDYKKSYVLFRSLPKIKSQIDELEKLVKAQQD